MVLPRSQNMDLVMTAIKCDLSVTVHSFILCLLLLFNHIAIFSDYMASSIYKIIKKFLQKVSCIFKAASAKRTLPGIEFVVVVVAVVVSQFPK